MKTRVELKRVEAAREVALEAIRSKQRRDAIAKHIVIIDKGIASNNQELILGGLRGLGQIVAASPFSNLHELERVLEGEGTIET